MAGFPQKAFSKSFIPSLREGENKGKVVLRGHTTAPVDNFLLRYAVCGSLNEEAISSSVKS